jgi:hypothetical protein
MPFVDLFRPSRWREHSQAFAACPAVPRDQRVYLGTLCLGMALILSASATKRGIYLLPLLPPLFLLLAAHASAWWTRLPRSDPKRSVAWWLQAACVIGWAAGPTAVVLGLLRSAHPWALAYLAALAVPAVALIVFARRGDGRRAIAALAICAVASAFGLLGVAARLAAPQKDMSPFVAWVDEQIPAGQSIVVVGDVDETVLGIVPFVTGRQVAPAAANDVAGLRPRWILVQDKNGGQTAPTFGPAYRLVDARSFGPGRYVALWERLTADAAEGDAVTSQPATPVQ